MENKLEQLLNSLIKRGRVPFGYELLYPDTIEDCFDYDSRRKKCRFLIHKNFVDEVHNSLREIVSKESGLWQFVCENGMYKKEALGLIFNDERAKNVFYKIDQFDEEGDVIQTGDMGGDEFIHISEPEYRLIESALRDESRLEDFLLQNIKVEGNEK